MIGSGNQRFRVPVSPALGISQDAGQGTRRIELVIFDESFGSLDKDGRREMIDEFHTLNSHSAPFFALLKPFLQSLSRERSGSEIQTMSCAITHCCYTVFGLITTSCELRGPFLPLRGEPYGVGFPAG